MSTGYDVIMRYEDKALVKRPTTLAEMRPIVLRVLQAHGIVSVRVFGPCACGEQTSESDLDLLVDDFPTGMSLLGLVGFKHELEAALKRKVDIVAEWNLKRALRDYVLADAKHF